MRHTANTVLLHDDKAGDTKFYNEALKTETGYFSETLLSTYESPRRHNPQGQNRHPHRRENLKSLNIL
jgi:hypothetical protein